MLPRHKSVYVVVAVMDVVQGNRIQCYQICKFTAYSREFLLNIEYFFQINEVIDKKKQPMKELL